MSASGAAGFSRTGKTLGRLMLLLLLLQWHFCPAAEPSDSSPNEAATVNAVWIRQQLTLYYTGHRTLYTCGTIEDKVRAVLLDMGARDDVRVDASGCASAFQFESRSIRPPGQPPQAVISVPAAAKGDIRITIEIATPTELTPALLGVLQQRQGERELLARIEGQPIASAGIRSFPARRQRAALNHSSHLLDDSDCELIEELRRQVLPQLGVQSIDNAGRCAAQQSSSRGSQAMLMADALLAVPDADSSFTPLNKAADAP